MIDFTTIAATVISGILTVVGSVFLAWLSSHMKDQAAAKVIGNAVQNALGAVQQAATVGLQAHPLQMTIPGISPSTAAGVQYVLDNAKPEIARFSSITPATIASKIEAQIGLGKIDTANNVAVAAAGATMVSAPVAAPAATGVGA